MCVAIKPNKAILLSLSVNSFLEDNPIKAFITAITNNKIVKYAQPECKLRIIV